MKKIYDKHFKISKNIPLTNHIFMNRIIVSICIIILCLSMTSLTAYAYFSYTISSRNNVIVSATYNLSVENKQGIIPTGNVYVLNNNSGVNQEYHFLLKESANSTATLGYGRIDINGVSYYTKPISDNTSSVIASARAYKIIVPAGQSYTVKFISEWGSCSQEAITSNGIISEIDLNTYNNVQVITYSTNKVV